MDPDEALLEKISSDEEEEESGNGNRQQSHQLLQQNGQTNHQRSSERGQWQQQNAQMGHHRSSSNSFITSLSGSGWSAAVCPPPPPPPPPPPSSALFSPCPPPPPQPILPAKSHQLSAGTKTTTRQDYQFFKVPAMPKLKTQQPPNSCPPPIVRSQPLENNGDFFFPRGRTFQPPISSQSSFYHSSTPQRRQNPFLTGKGPLLNNGRDGPKKPARLDEEKEKEGSSNSRKRHWTEEVPKPPPMLEAPEEVPKKTAPLDFGPPIAEWEDEELVDEDNERQQDGDDTTSLEQQVGESPFWTQSIAPGKYYARSRSGGQTATQSLCLLQEQFERNVLGRIRAGLAAQPKSDHQNPSSNTHSCSIHIHCNHQSRRRSSSASSSSSSSASSSTSKSPSSSSSSDKESKGKEKDTLNRGGRGRAGRKQRKRLAQKSGEDGHNGGKAKRRIRKATNSIVQKEIERKRTHPAALHPDIGFNEPGQLNDGPQCKCSWSAKQTGVRHGKYEGEKPVPRCDWNASNIDRLHHYVLSIYFSNSSLFFQVLHIEPSPAQFCRRTTQIRMDGHLYQFDGFSLFFHRPLPEHFPQRPINPWDPNYRVHFLRENSPESFTIKDLELFHYFLLENVLELYDLDRHLNVKDEVPTKDSCLFYHYLPRFARELPDNGKELLPMSAVLSHFNAAFTPLIDEGMAQHFHQNNSALLEYALTQKGQICVNPSKKPLAIRMDLLDAATNLEQICHKSGGNEAANFDHYPVITHFGVKPSVYAYSKKPLLQEALRKHVQLRKQLHNKSTPISPDEKRQLRESEAKWRAIQQECKSKRETFIRLSSRGFYRTGIQPDVVQHVLLLVLACQHVRFHCSLSNLEEERLGYAFKNRALLELALIHPSFRTNYGTNPDHVKNVLSNCGIRMAPNNNNSNNQKHPMVTNGTMEMGTPAMNGGAFKVPNGVRKGGFPNSASSSSLTPNSGQSSSAQKQQQMLGLQQSGRRRGIQVLLEVMAMPGSKQPCSEEQMQLVRHNERLEFLGDTVVEFLTTIHLFFLFTELDEGGLATFRSALVQNRHLATLADRLGLQHFMVYAHGPDLCHEADLRHAMANSFEALMAALFLDAGLEQCDRIFANALFNEDPKLLHIWNQLTEHPLKRDNPYGDRHLIEIVPCLQLLAQFEQCIGIQFKHIRLLAKAFTRRNIPYNFLTLGNNQRLEFLGDTVLQLLTSEYLYKHFPRHQEGHLSLLRTCLVSNRTQSVVCDDLAMSRYLVIPKQMLRKYPQAQLRIKDKADLVESFLGALYIDRGLLYCRRFCRVCFFPRLKYFIMNQRWNDPKSQLQQCCLTLRIPRTGNDPDIPEYKTIGIEGPTNTRVFRVAVYFRSKRLADGFGPSVRLAQMKAAENALAQHGHSFSTATPNQQQQHSSKATNSSRKC